MADSGPSPIDPAVRIGHVHLKVADLQRALDFYSGVLGFDVTQRMGQNAAFVSAGGYHHHIGLNTWAGVGAPPPPPGAIGLRHFTVRLPDVSALEDVAARLGRAGIPVETIGDAILTKDPSSNAILLATAP
jgi:catechol 2,3-dioxygenase